MIDPITFEVIRHALEFIAEEMGVALRNSAFSTNIKERMDHSCAVFDSFGNLATQAEHIPVHLGSLPWGIKNLIYYFAQNDIILYEGDIILVNDPYISGTHLNDLTLIKPVFYQNILIAFTANKAHHADVGGKYYGSISGDAETIYQEGVVLSPVKYFSKGVKCSRMEMEYLNQVKNPSIARGDLRAQVAALNLGERRLIELAKNYSGEILFRVYEQIMHHGKRRMIRALRGFPEGDITAEDVLEGVSPSSDFTRIRVALRKKNDFLEIDFHGTDPQVKSSFNIVPGGVLSASFFAVKSILDPGGGVNGGVLDRIQLITPPGSLVNPYKPAAVSGGNLETSQRIADVVFKALSQVFPHRVPAASNGSMNNVIAGGKHESSNEQWVYYETTGGGTGARPHENGIDGIHSNMTNTMNTPIEAIEQNYPIEFIEYRLRHNTGGTGRWKGGDGVVRSWKLTGSKAQVTVMGDRHIQPPWGLDGGGAGQPGEYSLERSDGTVDILGSKKTFTMKRGDVLTIKTPGGGGYGNVDKHTIRVNRNSDSADAGSRK